MRFYRLSENHQKWLFITGTPSELTHNNKRNTLYKNILYNRYKGYVMDDGSLAIGRYVGKSKHTFQIIKRFDEKFRPYCECTDANKKIRQDMMRLIAEFNKLERKFTRNRIFGLSNLDPVFQDTRLKWHQYKAVEKRKELIQSF